MTEQCTCGALFESPMHGDPEFIDHVTNGTHKAALLISVCGPCYMGCCKGCDKLRRSDVQRWKCHCLHDHPLIFDDEVASVDRMRRIWSEWLLNGRNSSVSLGTDEIPPLDKWHPFHKKEK